MSSPVAGPSRIPDDGRPAKQLRLADARDVTGRAPAGTQPAPGLQALPDDVLLLVIGLISVQDIIALRLSSRRFGPVTRLRWVWSEALTRHVVDRGLRVPMPVRDLKTLSAKQLELRARHATGFDANWFGAQPAPRHVLRFPAGSRIDELTQEEVPDAVSHVRFVPGTDGRWILVVQQNSVVCWEVPLGGDDAFVVAERSIPGGMIRDVAVNEDPDNPATLLVVWAQRPPYHLPTSQAREVVIEAWHMDWFHGTFTTLRTDAVQEHLRGRVLPLMRLTGDLALIGDPVAVWNWRVPGTYTMLNPHNIHASPVPDLLLAVRAVRGYLVIVRQSHLQILPLPSFDAQGRPVPRTNSGGAVYVHLLEAATEAAIVVHPLPPAERAAWLFDPVTVILRIANDAGGAALRTFDVAPRPAAPAAPPADAGCCAGCEKERARVLVATLPFHPPTQPSVTYALAPSAGRLTLGAAGAGKGLWLETRAVRRAREAFCVRAFVGFDVGAAFDAAAGAWRFAFAVRARAMHEARAGAGEVALKKWRIADVALEDAIGRVAVAGQDGAVEVLDYA